MPTRKIQITAPMHVSSAGYASGLASALKAVKALSDESTLDDVEREIEALLNKANHNLSFNNAVVAHREGFDPQYIRMRCKIDKVESRLFLHLTYLQSAAPVEI